MRTDEVASPRSYGLMRKVPQVTILFWIIKILTTANGESISDYLVYAMDPVIAVVLGGIVLLAALIIQFRTKKYIAWVYWFAVAMVAVTGTMAADVVHIVLGVPYVVSTVSFSVILAAIFWLWWKVEGTLSIHSIYTVRRELFYWATVMATFALGTAAGDMTAYSFHLGFLDSGVLFAVIITAIAVAHYALKGVMGLEHCHMTRNAVLAFWLAYIVTRPLGASFADWMGKAHSFGGLGWGDGTVSLGLTVLIVITVWYLARTRIDVERS
ncbi:MAG: hypothetical protein KGI69_00625 [Patescibacteria group bacterium]|nr:hypothetical protein [Patescibacteria group bacterium]